MRVPFIFAGTACVDRVADGARPSHDRPVDSTGLDATNAIATVGCATYAGCAMLNAEKMPAGRNDCERGR